MGTKTKILRELRDEASKQLLALDFTQLDALRLGRLDPIRQISLETVIKQDEIKLGKTSFRHIDMLEDGFVVGAMLENLRQELNKGLSSAKKARKPWTGVAAPTLLSGITGIQERSLRRLFNFDASAPPQQRVLDLVLFAAVAMTARLRADNSHHSWVYGPHQAVLCFTGSDGLEQQVGVIGDTIAVPFALDDYVPTAFAACGRSRPLDTARPEGGANPSPWARAWTWVTRDYGCPPDHPLPQALQALHWRTGTTDPDTVIWHPNGIGAALAKRKILTLICGEIENGYGIFHFRDWLVPHMMTAKTYEKTFVASVQGLGPASRKAIWQRSLKSLL